MAKEENDQLIMENKRLKKLSSSDSKSGLGMNVNNTNSTPFATPGGSPVPSPYPTKVAQENLSCPSSSQKSASSTFKSFFGM